MNTGEYSLPARRPITPSLARHPKPSLDGVTMTSLPRRIVDQRPMYRPIAAPRAAPTRSAAPAPVASKPTSVAAPLPVPKSLDFTPPKNRLRIAKKIGAWSFHAGILLILLASAAIPSAMIIGEALILVYAIISLIFRVESRIIFALALISLAGVLVTTIAGIPFATTYAIYAFLLLVVGTVSLGREVRSEA